MTSPAPLKPAGASGPSDRTLAPAPTPLLPLLLADLTATPGELGWMDSALCAQTDPEAFFPEKGGSTREAKRTCRACEVRAECLEYALEHDEHYGVWGGLSEAERKRLRSRQRVSSPRRRSETCGAGHLRTPETMRAGADGALRCRVCERGWAEASRNRKKAA
jgi:WhiB family transcriptional regulator, redox-sensing transcriptional regulator